jgi:hypothetical protein
VNKKSRYAVAIGLLIVIAAGFTLFNSQSNITAGSTCETKGLTKSNSGTEFICELSGEKLVWINSSAATGYAIGPGSRMVYQFVDGKMQRLNTYEVWQEKDGRTESDFDPIRVAAFKAIQSLEKDEKHANIKFEYTLRPSFPADVAEAIKLQSLDAAKRISPLLKKDLLIKLILVTEKDKEFIDKELPNLVPINDWQGALDSISSYQTLESFYSSSGTGGGTASFLTDKNFGYYIGHTSSLASMQTYWPEIAPHELTHVLQGVFANGFGSNYPDRHPQAKWSRHLLEGSANTVGMAMGFDQLGWYADEMDLLLRRSIQYGRSENYSNFDQLFPMKNISDAVNLMKEIESLSGRWQQDLSYSAGQFIWEFYIGKYGFDKYIELLTSLQKNSFADGIKKTIGISKDQFYQEVAPYLLANWQRLSS